MSVIAAQELGRYGVRVNAIAPSARTRMTLATPGLADRIAAPDDGSFDKWDPAHISPLIAWLCTEMCEATAQVYWVGGDEVARYLEWTRMDIAKTDGQWTIDDLQETVGGPSCEKLLEAESRCRRRGDGCRGDDDDPRVIRHRPGASP